MTPVRFSSVLNPCVASLPVGGPRHRQDRLAHVDVPLQRGTSVGHSPADRSVLAAQVLDLLGELERHSLRGGAELVHQRTERVHLLRHRPVVTGHLDELRHGDAGDGLALALGFQSRTTPCGLAIASGVSWVSGTATTSLRTPEVDGGELAELRRDRLPGVPVGAGLPRRRDCRVERVHERVHVGGVQVVLLVPGGGRKDDVGEDRRAGLPEVDRHQQVELPLGSLVTPLHVRRPLASGASVARSELSVPSRCLRKYSLPLPEDPSRFARQIDRIRG